MKMADLRSTLDSLLARASQEEQRMVQQQAELASIRRELSDKSAKIEKLQNTAKELEKKYQEALQHQQTVEGQLSVSDQTVDKLRSENELLRSQLQHKIQEVSVSTYPPPFYDHIKGKQKEFLLTSKISN